VDEAEKGDGVVLHDGVDGRKQVAHALHIAQVLIPLIVCEQDLLHLLEMDVGADLRERRVRIRVRAVLARKERQVPVGTMDVLLYRAHPV
jgi:hypothetical protein